MIRKAKQILNKFPEYYLVVLAIGSGYTPPFTFNPIFIGLAIIPILQIVFKNKISGLILGNIFFLLNLYFLGALISEFSEFTIYNKSAKQLLFVGLLLGSINMLASVVMLYKYAYTELEHNSKLQYKQ